MQRFLQFLDKTPEFRSIMDGILSDLKQQAIFGLSGSQKSFVVAALARKLQRPFLLVTHSEENALEFYANLQSLLPEHAIEYFPVLEWMPFEVLGSSKEVEATRLRVLAKLADDKPICIVTTIQAVERLFPPRQRWQGLCKSLRVGTRCDLKQLFISLTDLGYERVEIVDAPGQFSARGGIVDIYTLVSKPMRLEFFDDELDSVRTFDPVTQKSVEQLEQVNIYPARELIVPAAEREKAWLLIKAHAERLMVRLKKSSQSAATELQNHLNHLAEEFAAGVVGKKVEPYLNLAYSKLDSIFAYLQPATFIVLDEPVRIRDYLDFAVRERADGYAEMLQSGKVLADPNAVFLDFTHFTRELNAYQGLLLSTLQRQMPVIPPQNLVTFVTKPVQGFIGKLSDFAAELKELLNDGYGIIIFAGNGDQAQRLRDSLWDYGINAPVTNAPIELAQVSIVELGLKEGFQFPLAKLAVFTEYEIFRREHKPRPKVKVKPNKVEKLSHFIELKPGDYVVHANHGIGKYLGIEKLDVGGVGRDYFLIKYAGEDKLYVPSDQVDLIQKYLGGDGNAPKLYRLGGNDWVKVTSKVKAAVKDMAEDLLKLYAEREKSIGFAFSSESVWQKEFEDRFPYEATTDQLACIEDVKIDMGRTRPMDRIICGDVGYGKTEVAIRAAFKAVMDSKQVAVLVPTTILAQQHYVTFCERFSGYPLTIEMLSRFKSAKEQKQVIEGLKNGRVDVVIGTHRLVSEDIKFKDLGLVIVDEEQRFGVSHKEKLKRLKNNVDVLTLSATPIPRTLHMALVNIRDMSVIDTPPEDRYPVQTYVVEYSPELVREAVHREINRGGQVFFVHNKIKDMDKIILDLTNLIPEARIVHAHGQLPEEVLEKVMLDFMEKRYDILVCTTIIETGLDLPNVNTLIVNDADHMGLSQLYQLRGRVGRSNRKAFAYFLYRKDKVLTEVSEKRLSAIRDFTEFGSGFKIAMRDLELRGAGNLLGAEQHGQLMAVGFDMYCKLLEQAVSELKGEVTEAVIEPSIELNTNAFIASEFIRDNSVKTDFYQRLMRARSLEVLQDITDEMIDRFGEPPEPVVNLLDIVGLRIKAIKLGISTIGEEKGSIYYKFAKDPGYSGQELMDLAKLVGPSLSFSASNGLEISLRPNLKHNKTILKAAGDFLDKIFKIADKQIALV
ncbi:MAG: transcription-repair coupling factor [Peptococcaceae bacterium]|nr:transcription-repair coupling factor [Peptococcaceae bacterium]